MSRVSRGTMTLLAVAFVSCAIVVLAADRVRFIVTTAADFAARWTQSEPLQERTHDHPMQYLWSPPSRGGALRGVVIVVDGSDRDFRGLHAAFLRARRDLPFELIPPFVMSNGPSPKPADYPYTERDFETAVRDPLRFDLAGIDAIIHDVQRQNAVELPVFLTGFSAGGHVAWLFALEHANRLAGVAMASANFAMRGISSPPDFKVATPPAIRGFFCGADARAQALSARAELPPGAGVSMPEWLGGPLHRSGSVVCRGDSGERTCRVRRQG